MASCRFCGTTLHQTFVDLGMSPLCESYVGRDQLNQMEPFYPLHAYVCGECFLVQLEAFVSAEHIFSDYAYFSSYSDSWVEHCRVYTERMVERFHLGTRDQVVEPREQRRLPAPALRGQGHPEPGRRAGGECSRGRHAEGHPHRRQVLWENTARELAAEGRMADLLLGNNVLAQVPDLNDFVKGMKMLLKPQGVITLEFPHLMRLMGENQFDTIYHEHFSYFSLTTTVKIMAAHGLSVFDVEELPTHGGSLRVYARHFEDASKPVGDRVREILAREACAGFDTLECYARFEEQVKETKPSCWPSSSKPRRGEVHRRLRRTGQGEHPAQLLRHPVRLPRLHRGPQPAQARQILARNPRPDLPPRKDQGNKTGLRADPALESEDRNHGAGVVYPRLGWCFVVPIPEVEVCAPHRARTADRDGAPSSPAPGSTMSSSILVATRRHACCGRAQERWIRQRRIANGSWK